MKMNAYKASLLAATVTLLGQPALAQRPTLSADTLNYVSVKEPVIAITHVKVVDGTGAAPKAGQTIVLNDGVISALGPDASVKAPAGAHVIDGTGKTVIPGLIHMHEHLFYTLLQGKARLTASMPRPSPASTSRVALPLCAPAARITSPGTCMSATASIAASNPAPGWTPPAPTSTRKVRFRS